MDKLRDDPGVRTLRETAGGHAARVIDVNLTGTVHGSRAAIKTFQKQNNRGTLINVGSMLSMFAEPYLSAYVASNSRRQFHLRNKGPQFPTASEAAWR